MTSHVKRWTHSVICQLEGDAQEIDLYLAILDVMGDIDLISSFIGFDSDSGKYELIFSTVEKIDDSVKYDTLEQVRYLRHNFNIEGE